MRYRWVCRKQEGGCGWIAPSIYVLNPTHYDHPDSKVCPYCRTTMGVVREDLVETLRG